VEHARAVLDSIRVLTRKFDALSNDVRTQIRESENGIYQAIREVDSKAGDVRDRVIALESVSTSTEKEHGRVASWTVAIVSALVGGLVVGIIDLFAKK
jgi:hypothetical protein